jgi:hypothetical protein
VALKNNRSTSEHIPHCLSMITLDNCLLLCTYKLKIKKSIYPTLKEGFKSVKIYLTKVIMGMYKPAEANLVYYNYVQNRNQVEVFDVADDFYLVHQLRKRPDGVPSKVVNSADFLYVIEKMIEHDIIVFVSPVYWYSVSAELKVFIDRFSDLLTVHKSTGKKLKGKNIYLMTQGFFAKKILHWPIL